MEDDKLEEDFADLPEGEEPAADPEDGDGGDGDEKDEPAKPEPKKPEPPAGDDKDKKYQRILADKDRAVKEERRKAKELERELAELRGKVGKTQEAGATETEKPSIDPEKLKKEILTDIASKTYNEGIVSAIKAVPGINRAEAKELQEAVKKLPTSGDAAADVRAARYWLAAQRGEDVSSPPMPMGMGAGAFMNEQRPVNEPTARQKEFGRALGKLTDEDYKKYGAMPRL